MSSRTITRAAAAATLLLAGIWLWRGSGDAAPTLTKSAPVAALQSTPAAAQETLATRPCEGVQGRATGDKVASQTIRDSVPAPIVAFTNWLASWRQSGPETHAVLAARGRELALVRRAALKELIVSNPRLALEQAIPRSLRAELPASIVGELETPVDDFGRLEVLAVCFGSENRIERRVVIGERTYEAHVYGRRLEALTKSNLAIHGIAIDDRLAVSEVPYRHLEGAELAQQGAAGGTLTVAVGDKTASFATEADLAAWSERVGSAEASTGPNVSADLLTPQADPSSWVIGEKTVLWIRVDFSDAKIKPCQHCESCNSKEVARLHSCVSIWS